VTSKQLRLNRIFAADGRSLIVAMDHGISGLNPLDHLTFPRQLLPVVVANGADAIITTPGIARLCCDLFGRSGLILRIDGGPSALSGEWNKMELLLGVEDALRLGADAVIVMAITGTPEEAHSLANLGRLAAHCQEWGVPLVAEMLPGGFTSKTVTTEQLIVSARLAAELGADIVKIRYQGPAAEFQSVVSSSYIPVVIMGGSKQSEDQLVGEVRDALQAGCRGMAVGRNVWQAEIPAAITARLAQTIHTV
jgi:DhnA family fructose-bisphosphate aldolase class Ia